MRAKDPGSSPRPAGLLLGDRHPGSERALAALYGSWRQLDINLQFAVLRDESVPQPPDLRSGADPRLHGIDLHQWNPAPGDDDRLTGLRDLFAYLGQLRFRFVDPQGNHKRNQTSRLVGLATSGHHQAAISLGSAAIGERNEYNLAVDPAVAEQKSGCGEVELKEWIRSRRSLAEGLPWRI